MRTRTTNHTDEKIIEETEEELKEHIFEIRLTGLGETPEEARVNIAELIDRLADVEEENAQLKRELDNLRWRLFPYGRTSECLRGE